MDSGRNLLRVLIEAVFKVLKGPLSAATRDIIIQFQNYLAGTSVVAWQVKLMP